MDIEKAQKKHRQAKVPQENKKDLVEVSDYLEKAKEILETETKSNNVNTKNLQEAKTYIEKFQSYQKTPVLKKFLQRWIGLLYILAAGLAEAIFIEFYCLWHGASFISLDLYSELPPIK